MDKDIFNRISDTEISKFLKEHKNLTGYEFRKELIKRSQADVFDILDFKYQDIIHDWRKSLWIAENEIESLKRKIATLKSQPGNETDWEASH